MSDTRSAFTSEDANPLPNIVAGVLTVGALCMFGLLFVSQAFLNLAGEIVPAAHLQAALAALGTGGVVGTVLAGKKFTPERGRSQLSAGFAACLATAVLALVIRHEAMFFPLALAVGLSAGWTAVMLSLCLRPTLHFHRLGTWCGLGVGLAYAIANQPALFEASVSDKIVAAAVACVIGLIASFRMRSAPARPSSLPDYHARAAAGWIIVFFVLVFLDTLVFYIIQNSATLRKLSWETPLILQGNAFVHLCAAFVTGLILDQRWSGMMTLTALLLLVSSGLVLGLALDRFPTARILYVTAVSIYMTVLIYLPARGSRPQFTTALYALGGWLAAGLSLSLATAVTAREVPIWVLVFALVIGISALFSRLFWIRRMEEIESEKVVFRRDSVRAR